MLDSALFKALAAGLSIWESKEKTRYIDRLERAKRAFDDEYKKPPSERSDAVLDDCRFELRLVADSFHASTIGAKSAPHQP